MIFACAYFLGNSPFGGKLYPPPRRQSAPVPLVDGLLIVGISVAFFAILEIEKQIGLGLSG